MLPAVLLRVLPTALVVELELVSALVVAQPVAQCS